MRVKKSSENRNSDKKPAKHAQTSSSDSQNSYLINSRSETMEFLFHTKMFLRM